MAKEKTADELDRELFEESSPEDCVEVGDACLARKDYTGAHKWYHWAALKGDKNGMYNYALFLDKTGEGEENEEEYISWMEKAADLGHPKAQALFVDSDDEDGGESKVEAATEGKIPEDASDHSGSTYATVSAADFPTHDGLQSHAEMTAQLAGEAKGGGGMFGWFTGGGSH